MQINNRIVGAVIVVVIIAIYVLFFRTKSVDYYLNHYSKRIEKIGECSELQDSTKDNDCMNAFTAQRMFNNTRYNRN